MKPLAIALVIILSLLSPPTDGAAPTKRLTDLERAVVYAITLEAHASNLTERSDVCVAVGHGWKVNEKAIAAEIKHRGLEVHRNSWCNRGPRGLSIDMIGARTLDAVKGTYEIELQLGDLYIPPDEHFATLLRRGTYVIYFDDACQPRLLSYQETCCSE